MVITMTEEDFLKRWSRRKRDVAEAEKPAPPPAEARDMRPPPGDVVSGATKISDAEFDPATLPPIESITAISDVTAFLRAGVPVELTRAALRRVWTADPAIRDFVGLAENAWDFTDPAAMPGFGPLEATEEVRRMIAQVIDQIGEAARPEVTGTDAWGQKTSQTSNDSNVVGAREQDDGVSDHSPPTQDQIAASPAERAENQVLLHGNTEDTAVQRDAREDATEPKQLSRRIHGTALPR
jgi:uncharacterized protein DUF3306